MTRSRGKVRQKVRPESGQHTGRTGRLTRTLAGGPIAAADGATVATVAPAPTSLRVLLLNATHEPLAVVTGRRALVLVLSGKAECVVDRGQLQVHSPTLMIAVPAVVRLNRFVRVPYQPATAITRSGVLRRDGRVCVYCGGKADTIDHVQPRSRGGAHTWENCVACCARCNTRKADRLLSELGWTLPFSPGPPRRAGSGRVWLTDDNDPAWDPWLAGAA